MEELISVIIPVYKVERFLHRCVDSVLAQTYQNLEIILINDGSPDRCGKICDEYAGVDPRIQVIHKENGGISEARNAGIDLSQGTYLTFLDSDDWVDPKYIEKLYHLLKTTGSDISVCNFIHTSNEDIQVDKSNIKIFKFSNIEALKQLSGHFYGKFIIAWGKLYHRDLFADIRYPLGRIHEDAFVAHHLFYRATRVVYTTEQLLYYWQRPDSIMGSGFNIKYRHDLVQATMNNAKFLKEIGLNEQSHIEFRRAFVFFIHMMDKKNKYQNYIKKEELIEEFNSLKNELRKGEYSLTFKTYYELYYANPYVMGVAHKIYSKSIGLRRRLSNISQQKDSKRNVK